MMRATRGRDPSFPPGCPLLSWPDSSEAFTLVQNGHRGPGDDFFCWKFRVWYNLEDCVFRHTYRTTPECAACGQGASNTRLVRHKPEPPRWVRILSVDESVRPRERRRMEAAHR